MTSKTSIEEIQLVGVSILTTISRNSCSTLQFSSSSERSDIFSSISYLRDLLLLFVDPAISRPIEGRYRTLLTAAYQPLITFISLKIRDPLMQRRLLLLLLSLFQHKCCPFLFTPSRVIETLRCASPTRGLFTAYSTRPPIRTSLMATNKGLGPGKATRCAPSVTSPLILYIKAAKDGKSTGDCPFAHAVRMGLSSKGAPCVIHPTTASTKPSWLLEHYEGKMPALKHESDCYVESRRILQYIDFFFEVRKNL